MKKQIVLLTAMLMLTSCSESRSDGSSDKTSIEMDISPSTTTAIDISVPDAAYVKTTEIEVVPDEVLPTEPIVPEGIETTDLSGEITAFDGESMTVSSDGKEYKLDLSECNYNTVLRNNYYPDLPLRIIKNPFNIKVNAELKCDTKLTKVYYCDVINPNGVFDSAQADTDKPETEFAHDIYSYLGKGNLSIYEFTSVEITDKNEYRGTGIIDLSAADIFMAPQFDEGTPFGATCFKFNDKECFLSLKLYATRDKDAPSGSQYSASCTKDPIYYGEVTAVSDKKERVTIRLNGGSECSMKPSVTIGCNSLSIGDKVRAHFTDKTDLNENPEKTDFDFAVIEPVTELKLEDISFRDQKITAAKEDESYTIFYDKLIDAETLEAVSDTTGYSKACVPPEIIKYSDKLGKAYTFYAMMVLLER